MCREGALECPLPLMPCICALCIWHMQGIRGRGNALHMSPLPRMPSASNALHMCPLHMYTHRKRKGERERECVRERERKREIHKVRSAHLGEVLT